MEKIIRRLIDDNLYKSAYILVSGLIGNISKKQSSLSIEHRLLCGDALFGLHQYRRALTYYLDALKDNSLQRQLRSKPNASKNEIKLKAKIALCYVELKEDKQALKILLTIPREELTAAQGMMLVKLLKKNRKPTNEIIDCYRHVLSLEPMAIEARLSLIQLGISPSELPKALLLSNDPTATRSSKSLRPFHLSSTKRGKSKEKGSKKQNANTTLPPPWINALVESQELQKMHEYAQALDILKKICNNSPRNVDLLLRKATVEMQICDVSVPLKTLAKVHDIDPSNINQMDMYALFLRMRGQGNQLTNLSYHMLGVDETKAQTWSVLALYADQTGQKEQALKYVDKAIYIDNDHIGSYIVKGFLALSSKEHNEEAVKAYNRAYQIDKINMCVLQGLVESFLAVSKFRQALQTAKEALQKMPRNPRALTLIGKVCSHSKEGRPKAVKAFTKALKLDSHCWEAGMKLAEIFCIKKEYSRALDLLNKFVNWCQPQEYMHYKLAQVYVLNGELDNAMIHFHTALSLSPDYEPARRGMTNLQDVIKEKEEKEAQKRESRRDHPRTPPRRRNKHRARKYNSDDESSGGIY